MPIRESVARIAKLMTKILCVFFFINDKNYSCEAETSIVKVSVDTLFLSSNTFNCTV